MAIVTKGFVVKEKWLDEFGKSHSKQWGRRYHIESSARLLAALVAQQLDDQLNDDHTVSVEPVRGEDGISAAA